MYIPKHFKVDDQEFIFDFIEDNSFGMLLSNQNEHLEGTHLPFYLDRENKYLYGHLAKANPHWEDIQNQESLVVFQGPHHYISPTWYETNESVPTWNYVAVHVYGNVELIRDQEHLVHILKDSVEKYEGPNSSYQIDEANSDYIEGMMHAIVGFRLKINRLEGKWKLSQDKSEERQRRIIQQLNQLSTDNARKISTFMQMNENRRS